MASYRPTVIADPAILQRMHPDRLVQLVSSAQEYLKRRGVPDYVGGIFNELYCAKVAEVIETPTPDVPADFAEVVCNIDLLSQPFYNTELHDLCGPDMRLRQSESPADLAVRAWFEHPAAAFQVLMKASLRSRRTFHHFWFQVQKETHPIPSSEVEPSTLKAALADFFRSKSRSADVQVRFLPVQDETWIRVRHGKTFTRSGTAGDPKNTSVAYHPIHYDIIVLYGGGLHVRLNVEIAKSIEVYLNLIRAHFFTGNDVESHPRRLTLRPLQDDRSQALRCDDFPDIQSITWKSIKYWRGERYVHERSPKGDLAELLGPDELQGKRLIEAAFEFEFHKRPGERRKKVRSLTVSEMGITKVTRDDDAQTMERWLQARRYLEEPTG